MEIFINILFGHLVGDYLLQSKKMAFFKSENTSRGYLWCFIHSLIYTASICLFLWTLNPVIIILVFMSHYPIDKWSLASKWLKLIGGRDFIKAYESTEKYREIDISFSAIVYTVVDNTFHLLLLWGIVHWFVL